MISLQAGEGGTGGTAGQPPTPSYAARCRLVVALAEHDEVREAVLGGPANDLLQRVGAALVVEGRGENGEELGDYGVHLDAWSWLRRQHDLGVLLPRKVRCELVVGFVALHLDVVRPHNRVVNLARIVERPWLLSSRCSSAEPLVLCLSLSAPLPLRRLLRVELRGHDLGPLYFIANISRSRLSYRLAGACGGAPCARASCSGL